MLPFSTTARNVSIFDYFPPLMEMVAFLFSWHTDEKSLLTSTSSMIPTSSIILRINLDGIELFPEGYGACDDSFEETRPEQA